MAKYIVETFYTCSFKIVHKLDELNEKKLSELENRHDGEVQVIDIRLNNRKTKTVGIKNNLENSPDKFHSKSTSAISSLINEKIVNSDKLWNQTNLVREQSIDTEIIAAIAIDHINSGEPLDTLSSQIFSKCQGVVACAIVFPKLGKLVLLSNNGSLYVGSKEKDIFFSSEKYPLNVLACEDVKQVLNDYRIVDIPINIAALTNISQDHLDFHRSIKNYRREW